MALENGTSLGSGEAESNQVWDHQNGYSNILQLDDFTRDSTTVTTLVKAVKSKTTNGRSPLSQQDSFGVDSQGEGGNPLLIPTTRKPIDYTNGTTSVDTSSSTSTTDATSTTNNTP